MATSRLPTETKKLRGTDQPSRRAPAVVGNYEVPRMPHGMDKAAVKHWKKMIPGIAARGIIQPTDIPALKDMCEVLARLDECEAILSKEGLVVDGRMGPVRNPAATMASQYRGAWLKYAARFALTPVDRAGITVSSPKEKSLAETLNDMVKEAAVER
jgi:P27 family predicted phage terminase small subunit